MGNIKSFKRKIQLAQHGIRSKKLGRWVWNSGDKTEALKVFHGKLLTR